MRSPAIRSLERRVGVAVLLLGALFGPLSVSATAQEAGEEISSPAVRLTAAPYADRFPNVVLKTHEGRNVRFYDDLLEGKIVLINFFYVTCGES